MKQVTTIIFVFFALTIFAQNNDVKIEWLTFEKAIELQTENPKKIFIDVYTDWCGYCKKMDRETFSNPEIIKYINQNFYPVKFNAEQKADVIFQGETYKFIKSNKGRGSHQLAQALLQGRMSYPSYAFLNEKTQLITVVPGYFPANRFEPIIHFFGKDAFLNTKWEDFSKDFESKLK